MQTKRPHIIIFNPDEMRADSLAHLGANPAAITPFLDEFSATDAVSFSNAYCQNPVCVPSRCSFFTGLYPHVYGHRTMQHMLRAHEPSLFSELKDAGYYVWMNTRNDLVAGQIPGLFESHASEIYYGGDHPAPPGPVNKNYRGEPGDKNYYSHYEGALQTDENNINYSPDDAVVDAAINRLLNPVDEKPMCMFLGLSFPHTPYAVEEPYFSTIDRSKLPKRAGIGTNKPKIQQLLRQNMAMDEYTEDDWAEMRAVYLGMCMKIDAQFKRLCHVLKEAGIYDDCAIFFFSDHGDYTGDYGIPEKAQNTFEDCLTKVPLLIKPPKWIDLDAGITDSFAELIDFYATAMDFAGAEPSHDHFGKSLRPILANRNITQREYAFCEGGRMPWEKQASEYHAVAGANGTVPRASMYWPRQTAQSDDEAHAKGTMIRDKQYKYIQRSSGAHEFYDLKLDPLEEHNVIDNPQYATQIIRMKSDLLDWYQCTCDIVPLDYDARVTPEMMWMRVAHRCTPDMENAVKDMARTGMGPAVINAKITEMLKNKC